MSPISDLNLSRAVGTMRRSLLWDAEAEGTSAPRNATYRGYTYLVDLFELKLENKRVLKLIQHCSRPS